MWSSWQNIEHAKAEQRGYYGLYQIRMVNEIGNPLPIQRIAGIDKEGIIYIGRAIPRNTLARRIREFQGTAQLKNASHSGGETYVLMQTNLKYSDHTYKNHKLQYRVKHLYTDRIELELDEQENFKHKVKKGEEKALADYFNKYAELPPCNSNFPGKWSGFTNRLKELWGMGRQE